MRNLHEFCTREEWTLLRESATPPDGLPLLSIIHHLLHSSFPDSAFRIFGAPSHKPHSVIVIEKNHYTHPFIYLATLWGELDGEEMTGLLDAFVRQEGHLLKKGCLVDADEPILDLFVQVCQVVKLELSHARNECHLWYMNDENMRRCHEMVISPPEGFVFDRLSHEKDLDVIHSSWKHASTPTATKMRLRDLPSACARESEEGPPLAWEMASQFGQLSHLFTLPQYRRRGLGAKIELLQAQNFCRLGLRPFKYIEVDNEIAIRLSKEGGFWERWEREGKPIRHCFANFSPNITTNEL